MRRLGRWPTSRSIWLNTTASSPPARFLAQSLEQQLGTPVQVVNKGGASGQVGNTALVNSKPDGYTLEIVVFPPLLITYLDASRGAAYMRKDFQSIAMYFDASQALVVKSDSPFKDLKGVVDAAKEKPGQIKDGTGGLLLAPHLSHLAFQKVAGIQLSFVHFNGGGPAMTAVLGGHVDIGAVGLSSTISPMKAGTAKVLGVPDKEENRLAPGVKTFAQQGYPVFSSSAYAVVAPAGTPKDVVDILTGAVKKATQDQDVKAKLEQLALNTRYMTPSEMDAYWTDKEVEVKDLMKLAQ